MRINDFPYALGSPKKQFANGILAANGNRYFAIRRDINGDGIVADYYENIFNYGYAFYGLPFVDTLEEALDNLKAEMDKYDGWESGRKFDEWWQKYGKNQ